MDSEWMNTPYQHDNADPLDQNHMPNAASAVTQINCWIKNLGTWKEMFKKFRDIENFFK